MAAMVTTAEPAKVESYDGWSGRESFRLTNDHIVTLRAVFTEGEGDAGLKSVWWHQVDFACGVPDTGERVHMFDAEAWCDRKDVFASNGKSAKMRRCREALIDLAEGPQPQDALVLRRMYGQTDPNARANSGMLGELAPLADLTEAVIEAARVYESARRVEAGARFDRFWVDESAAAEAYQAREGEHLKKGKLTGYCLLDERARYAHLGKKSAARSLHKARVMADAPLDTARALREGLDIHVHQREGESKGAYSERQMRKRAERVEFVSAITRQADKLLADASTAYRAAWGKTR